MIDINICKSCSKFDSDNLLETCTMWLNYRSGCGIYSSEYFNEEEFAKGVVALPDFCPYSTEQLLSTQKNQEIRELNEKETENFVDEIFYKELIKELSKHEIQNEQKEFS